MQKLVKISGVLFFLSAVAVADFTVKEKLIGEYIEGSGKEALDASKASFQKQCDQWKTEVEKDLGTSVVFASCGARKDVPSKGSYQVKTGSKSCSQQCHTNSGGFTNCQMECYPETHETHSYTKGYYSRSEAILRVRYEGEPIIETQEVIGDSLLEEDGLEAAIPSYQQACRRWKTETQTQFGANFLYASCADDSRPISNIGMGDVIQLSSKGLLFLRK